MQIGLIRQAKNPFFKGDKNGMEESICHQWNIGAIGIRRLYR